MENKGQISAEYLLTVVVILIILASVSIPLVGKSVNDTMDISESADVDNAVNSIANAVNLVYANGPGAKRTISIYMPISQTLTVEGGNLQMNVPLNTPLNGESSKSITANINYNVTINNPTFSKGWHTVTVTWPTAGDYSPITISH
ncbi:MAG TPA: hypothetical protein GX531_05870 [Methanothermobacter sp.]|nr:hypothetical protein [Methanothermobacter sp.]